MLAAAMNPCACGYYPDLGRCRCTPSEVKRYLGKLSGPLLDRVDVCVDIREPTYAQMAQSGRGISSEELRRKVIQAQRVQEKRYQGTDIRFNSQLDGRNVEDYCVMTEGSRRWMERIYTKLRLSPRAYHRIIKVSRTIADLDQSELIEDIHVQEAYGYRMAQGGVYDSIY